MLPVKTSKVFKKEYHLFKRLFSNQSMNQMAGLNRNTTKSPSSDGKRVPSMPTNQWKKQDTDLTEEASPRPSFSASSLPSPTRRKMGKFQCDLLIVKNALHIRRKVGVECSFFKCNKMIVVNNSLSDPFKKYRVDSPSQFPSRGNLGRVF